LIFRAIGLELRGQLDNKIWHAIWDKSFGIASLLLALFFGVALGNVIRGVNLGMVTDGISAYEAHYFFLLLWNSSFSTNAEHLGVIDWFTLLLGIILVVAFTIHGANCIIFKTNADFNHKLKKVVLTLSLILLLLIVISLSVWHIVEPSPFENFVKYPWLILFPLIALVGLFGLFKVKTIRKDGMGFLDRKS